MVQPQNPNPKLQLGSRDQELHRLLRRQHLRHSPNRPHPQLIRLHQHTHQSSDLLLHIPIPTCLHQLHCSLLPLGQLPRDLVLLPHRLALQLAHPMELSGGEVAQVAGAYAVEDVGDVGLEAGAGLGVYEVKNDGGTPPGDPVEGAFEGGGPWGREEWNGVVLGGDGLGSVVLGVVRNDLLDQLEQGWVVLWGGGLGREGELVHQVVQVVEPWGVESVERHCVRFCARL